MAVIWIRFGRHLRPGLAIAICLLAGNFFPGETAAMEKEKLAFSGLERITDQRLRDGVERYYVAEAAKRWEGTYALRRLKFYSVVLFPTYQRIMSEDTEGWNLVELEILGSREGVIRLSEMSNPEVTFVRIEFTETLQKGHNRFPRLAESRVSEDRTFVAVEETAWLVENGKVKCLHCGTRGHIFLNIPMRYD